MRVSLETVKSVAGTPPKDTLLVPVNRLPLIVTSVPIEPLDGVNELIVGGRMTTKLELL